MSQPTPTRQGINLAVFGLLQSLPGVKTISRRWREWSDVPADQQPAVFLTGGPEHPKHSADGNATTWTRSFDCCMYNFSSDLNQPPLDLLNSYLDAIEAALAPPAGPPGFPSTVQVLGDTTGHIRHAWLSDIHTDDGSLDGQAIAIFSIEVEVIA